MQDSSSEKGTAAVVVDHFRNAPRKGSTQNAQSTFKGLAGLSEGDLFALSGALEQTIIHYIEIGHPVYLEGLGILYPKTVPHTRIHNIKDKFVIRAEIGRSLGFEKCYDLVQFHREKYQGIVEIRDLSIMIKEKTTPLFSRPFSDQEIRKALRAFLELIKREVIISGISKQLSGVGEFYALHNRQGSCFRDWYAGADIFLRSRYHQTLSIGESSVHPRPVFEHSGEPFETLYGSTSTELSLDLLSELRSLGYDVSELGSDLALSHGAIKVKVYSDSSGYERSPLLIYVSDGLRNIALGREGRTRGTEFIVQVPLRHSIGSEEVDSSTPLWPLRLFTLGWILMQSSKTLSVKPGAGLSADTSLVSGFDSELTTIFTSKYPRLKNEQLSPEGPFEYISLAGITEDEFDVARRYTPELLAILLEHRKLDQVTKPTRSSIVAKTGLLSEAVLETNESVVISEPSPSENSVYINRLNTER